MDFSKKLKEYRISKGITQAAMAQYLGMSERGYRFYENGQREPNLSTLVLIADYLNVSLDDLVGRTFPKNTLVNTE